MLSVARPQASFLGSEEFWNNARHIFFGLLEGYNGIGVALVGLIGSVYFFKKRDWKWFGLCLAFIAGGSIFGYDGIWSVINRH